MTTARSKQGRPKGSKNAVDVVVVERSPCPKCGSSRRSEYWGKVVTHARYVTFQMAEVAVPRKLFREILRRIRRLREPVPG